jgi:flagellin
MKIGNSGILRNLLNTQNKLKNNLSRLSSGKRTSASADPAGLAIASGLEAQVRSLGRVNQSIQYTQSALQTADGALSSVSSDLQRLRELAVQASNGTLGEQDRANLQQEFDQIVSNIDQTASQTKFGSQSLLDGSFSQEVQTGSEAGQTQTVSIDGVSSTQLGINAEGVSTQEAAQDALAAIDSALESVNSARANIGAQQNALEFRTNTNSVQAENLAAAQSQIEDVDLAAEITELAKNKLQVKAKLAALKAENDTYESFSREIFGRGKKRSN